MTRLGDRARGAATILLLALALAPAARAQLIQNGGFETGPAVQLGGTTQLAMGATDVAGWVVTHAPIEVVDNEYWQAFEGGRSLGLNPTATPGGIAQSFATAPGALYQVAFVLSGEPFTDPALKQIRVSAAGQQADFSFDTSTNWHWAMGWTPHTWSFTANAANSTLEFLSLTSGVASPALDDVVVTLLSAAVGERGPALALAMTSSNPAVGTASFDYALPQAGPATLAVMDAQGRRVASLATGTQPAGTHHARWDARGASPGVYFVTLHADGRVITRRFALLQ